MEKQNLQQLIKKLKLDYCNTSITESNFPTISQGEITKLFKFENSYTTKEAKDRLEKEGYRPATAWELLNWAVKNWNSKDCIVALGQEYLVASGDPRVVCLWGGSGLRGLSLGWVGGWWGSDALVAGVRKSSELKSSDTSELDSLKLRISELEKFREKVEKVIKLD